MDWYVVVWLVVQAVAIVVAFGLVVETHRDTAALRRLNVGGNGRQRVARRNTRRAWARLLVGVAFALGGVAVIADWRIGDTPVLALALIAGALVLTADAVEDWWSMRRWDAS